MWGHLKQTGEYRRCPGKVENMRNPVLRGAVKRLPPPLSLDNLALQSTGSGFERTQHQRSSWILSEEGSLNIQAVSKGE